MPFSHRVTHINSVPARSYFYHSIDARLDSIFTSIEEAARFAHESVTSNKRKPFECDFVLQFIWANENKPVLEIVGYKMYDQNWQKANPQRHEWVYHGHREMPKIRRVGCEESSIIIGREAELRRRTRDLNEYFSSTPDLGNLEPENDYFYKKDELTERFPKLEKALQ